MCEVSSSWYCLFTDADQDVLYKHAKVIYDYKAQNEEDLNITEGDIITDVIELENGWWQVSTTFLF